MGWHSVPGYERAHADPCYGRAQTAGEAGMDAERERALTLAHEAEAKDGLSPAAAVVERARVYLHFLLNVSDANPDPRAAAEAERRGF